MVAFYTTAVNIDPEVAEEIYQQKVYNLCVRYNIQYTQDTYIKAYSHLGMFNGYKIVINILAVIS